MELKYLGYLIFTLSVFYISYQYSKKILDWLKYQSIGTRDYIVDKLSQMFIEIPPQRILLALLSLSIGLGLIVFVLFLPQLFPAVIFGIIVAILGWKLPKPVVNFIYKKRVEKFVLQMVDGLSLMSNGMKSGLSVVQSLSLIVTEMPNPIKQEFNLVLNENKLGISLEEAFTNLSKRIVSDDVEMFVTAVNILKETGGNLAETLDTISSTIRERVKVEKKISAMTAQGLYQGILVMCIPPLLGTFFYFSDPNFMLPLFTTTIGWGLILIIILLELIGFFVILKIIKIEV
ncbi:MAG: type II secretion system F family protein [Bdellovibrio sp.]|nr:type II secretion system F family protein [Bdellovibrio sp.]